jgi:hypothetical protein
MRKIKIAKHCNNCNHSYYAADTDEAAKTQHCSSPEYNSPEYTEEMLMADWDKGYCRFWSLRITKGKRVS